MKCKLFKIDKELQGEIRKITTTWTVQCRNCQRVVTKDFSRIDGFEKHLNEIGWKCGYDNKEVWFCPECAKGI